MALTIKKVRRRSGDVNDLARVVIQLERFPFSLLDLNAADRGGELRPQLEVNFEIGGEACAWQATGEGPDGKPSISLPGPYGNDVMVALGRAWNAMAFEPWEPSEEGHRTIRLQHRRLLELMGRTPGTTAYEALDETLERLSSLVIRAKGAWRENGEWVDGWQAITVFETINSKRRRGANERGTVTFVFTPTFAKALLTDSRLLDTRPYNALKLSTARRLYRLLDTERYQRHHGGVMELRLPVAQVGERMPLSETKPNKLKRTLDRAHEELVAAGFLVDMPTYSEEQVSGRRYPAVYVTYRFAQSVVTGKGSARELSVPTAGGGSTDEVRELKRFAGVPERPDLRSELAVWVQQIERTLGDARSSGFYKQVAEAFLAAGATETLDFVLRGVAKDGQGMNATALGAAFTSRIKARARHLGIALPDATRGDRAGAPSRLADILPGAGRTTVDGASRAEARRR